MRLTTLAIVTAFVVLAPDIAAADEFKAWVFLVEGNKVSFVKDDMDSKTKGPPKTPPMTLTVADNVQVLQGGYNQATKKYEGAIVESGLNYDLFKGLKLASKGAKKGTRYHLTQLVTNDENQITEIRLNDDVAAKIVKVEGNTLTIVQTWGSGFYGGAEEGPPRQNLAADNVKVVKGWLNPETKKFEGTEVEGGLKNEIFKSTVRARVTFSTTPSGGSLVTLIRVFDETKIPNLKK
jgi:hypothetical protein